MDTPSPTPQPSDDAPEPRRTRLIPDDQDKLSELMTLVAASSAGSPYELSWKSHVEATQLAQELAVSVAERGKLGDEREPKSARIRELQRELNKGATRVKNYINEKWENDAEAESYYASFGFVEENDDDVLPSAQKGRAKAIEDQLLPALTQHDMGDEKYGTAWWTPRLAEYKALTGQSQKTARDISEAVGEKNPLADEARLYLTRFDALLFAETRSDDEYLALRRQMGYLKEYN
ncbi:MAG: hypothetical protein H7330_03455 [Hymenobacteraceae bacterium]|nr:hypothetical protein [Hymenobacteraceae bacterium]